MIKEYFANYLLHLADNRIEVHPRRAEPWRVTLVDTGENTMTGGRLKRVAGHIDDTFCLTYGDGLADVDVTDLVAFHRLQGTEATVTAIQPTARFGVLELVGDRAGRFEEKPRGDGQCINGGFFVCEPSVLDRVDGDGCHWEREPLEGLFA